MLISRASIRIALTSAARVNPPPAQINGELNMEPTLTHNCALYYAQQHKTSKRRAALFKRFRAAARKRGPEVRRQLTAGELFIVQRLHQDTGRCAASSIESWGPRLSQVHRTKKPIILRCTF